MSVRNHSAWKKERKTLKVMHWLDKVVSLSENKEKVIEEIMR